MNEILEILKVHAAKYPKMLPADAVKLIYQNEFGGGHLISSPDKSLEYLKKEYESVEKITYAEPCEDIGNGIVRIYLSAIGGIITLEELNRIFVASSKIHNGNIGSFIAKLDLLSEHFDSIGFGFSHVELDGYLDKYKKSGCPMVSHSEIYRENYRPAYRIVEKRLWDDHT